VRQVPANKETTPMEVKELGGKQIEADEDGFIHMV
jgi:hypothetical protein